MKVKKKLRDVTSIEFVLWKKENCVKIKCRDCVMNGINCSQSMTGCDYIWIGNKNKFSDEFLNQEIEIEDPDILNEVEKNYLKAVIKPFKDTIQYIVYLKTVFLDESFVEVERRKLKIYVLEHETHPYWYKLPATKGFFEGMEFNKEYTLKELGLD